MVSAPSLYSANFTKLLSSTMDTIAPALPFSPRPKVTQQLHKHGLPVGLKVLLLCFLAMAVFSPDRELGIYGVAVLWVAARLLWKPGQPQTLFFVILFQWFQAFGPVMQGFLDGRAYQDIIGIPEVDTATWLSLTGIGILSIGLKLGSRRTEPKGLKKSVSGLKHLKNGRLVIAYIFASVAALTIRVAGGVYAPFIQAGSAVEIVKWGVVLLIFYRWTAMGQGGILALAILIFESIIGMAGFFSSFKTGFFILIIAGSGSVNLSRNRAAIFALLAFVLLLFLGFWQVVKGYYRSFMSEGEKAQVITVSVTDRMEWMGQAMNLVGFDNIQQGWQDGLRRLSYVDFFGYAIKTVPSAVKHTDGLLWREAIQHTLMPRFLFPNKAAIDDSLRTSAYCGMTVTGADEGTSISIGYMGESYIDFGSIGMFIPILLWGWGLGWCYGWLRKNTPHPLLGMACGTGLLVLTALLLETSNIKMLGGLIVAFLGLVIFVKLFARGFWYWLIYGDLRSRALLRGYELRGKKR